MPQRSLSRESEMEWFRPMRTGCDTPIVHHTTALYFAESLQHKKLCSTTLFALVNPSGMEAWDSVSSMQVRRGTITFPFGSHTTSGRVVVDFYEMRVIGAELAAPFNTSSKLAASVYTRSRYCVIRERNLSRTMGTLHHSSLCTSVLYNQDMDVQRRRSRYYRLDQSQSLDMVSCNALRSTQSAAVSCAHGRGLEGQKHLHVVQ